MGEFEAADALGDGSGEGSFFVAEEFAFDQAGGDGGAVQFHEGRVGAAGEAMDGAGDQFFAGAGFTLNQDRGIGGCGGLNLLEDAAKGGAGADDFIEAVFAADFLFEINFFVFDMAAKLVYFFKGGGVFVGDGDLPADVLHEFAVFLGVGIGAQELKAMTPCKPRGVVRATQKPQRILYWR